MTGKMPVLLQILRGVRVPTRVSCLEAAGKPAGQRCIIGASVGCVFASGKIDKVR